ncbi:MAG: hypothetical protein ABI867_21970 [Kofleriaceae bacterium]
MPLDASARDPSRPIAKPAWLLVFAVSQATRCVPVDRVQASESPGMRMLLGLAVLCAGCMNLGAESDFLERAELAPDDHASLTKEQDAPASCTASAAMAAQPASAFTPDACAATLDVFVTCASRQDHDWIRFGMVVDGDVALFDTRYACNTMNSHTFAVPCDAGTIYGGAVLDHPQSSTDVACVSARI